MLVNPPAQVHCDQETDQQPDQLVVAGRPGNLVVTGIMAQERDLGKHEPQENGVQKLNSQMVDGGQDGEACPQQNQGGNDLERVIAGLSVQQAFAADPAPEFSKCVAVAGGLGRFEGDLAVERVGLSPAIRVNADV